MLPGPICRLRPEPWARAGHWHGQDRQELGTRWVANHGSRQLLQLPVMAATAAQRRQLLLSGVAAAAAADNFPSDNGQCLRFLDYRICCAPTANVARRLPTSPLPQQPQGRRAGGCPLPQGNVSLDDWRCSRCLQLCVRRRQRKRSSNAAPGHCCCLRRRRRQRRAVAAVDYKLQSSSLNPQDDGLCRTRQQELPRWPDVRPKLRCSCCRRRQSRRLPSLPRQSRLRRW